MPLNVGRKPVANPSTMPASGADVIISFDARAVEEPTRLRATYTIEDDPYVFDDSEDPKRIEGTAQKVPVDGKTYPKSVTLKKSPPAAPRIEFLPVQIEIVEVDDDGEPVTLPSGRPKSPTTRTVMITIA